MRSLTNKRILLGVTGGIAAYKSAELVRGLRAAGAEVRVVMTDAATAFITPLTLQALSGYPVRRGLMDETAEAGMGHIELARWADAVVVAPASADFLARLATGRADDLLATLCLAGDAPLALAPAMNRLMWSNPATQANARTLASRGVRLWGPGEGEQACGELGAGRMLEPDVLVEHVVALFATGALAGLGVVVTAGPTREPLDAVRYVGNRSSGRMGFALARAAAEAGARVTLVAGPTRESTPEGVDRVDVETATQMHDAVLDRVAGSDLFIGAAAVADYMPAAPEHQKLKKTADGLSLELAPTPDIIADVARLEQRPFIVGLAAETDQDLRGRAEAKRRDKALDVVAANRVGEPGLGFESETNAFEVAWAGGGTTLDVATKERLARRLVAIVAERYHAQRSG